MQVARNSLVITRSNAEIQDNWAKAYIGKTQLVQNKGMVLVLPAHQWDYFNDIMMAYRPLLVIYSPNTIALPTRLPLVVSYNPAIT